MRLHFADASGALDDGVHGGGLGAVAALYVIKQRTARRDDHVKAPDPAKFAKAATSPLDHPSLLPGRHKIRVHGGTHETDDTVLSTSFTPSGQRMKQDDRRRRLRRVLVMQIDALQQSIRPMGA